MVKRYEKVKKLQKGDDLSVYDVKRGQLHEKTVDFWYGGTDACLNINVNQKQ